MCTTIIVGKNATKDGSVIVAHSDDDVDDGRVIRVPSLSMPTRNVYYSNASLGSNTQYNSTDIRRYIGTDRGEGYNTLSEGYASSVPLGNIPGQEGNTYAYFDSSYGIVNEKGLMIGECTCGAKFTPDPDPQKRIFYSSELSRVALERCTKAREAVELIGKLLIEYGYYGTGETLLLGDADEGWVMEMCAYEEDGTSGIWVAQRVPDDEFFVAANEFRIRDVYKNPKDTKQLRQMEPGYFNAYNEAGEERKDLIYSSNLFAACQGAEWIKEENAIDWLPTVSYGEYGHPYYALRRVWRAFSKVAPLLNLPAKVEDGYTRAYPFSVKPENKLSVLDVAAVYRDHYEGTEFDQTIGIGAGPFRNPVRYEVNPDKGDSNNLNTYKLKGAWERTISIYRCGVLWINQAKHVNDQQETITWIGLDRPAANCLMPFHSSTPSLPAKIQTMNLLEFEFNGNSAWWAFNFVANYVNLNYQYMMQDLKALQQKLENEAQEAVQKMLCEKNLDELDQFSNDHFEKVISQWWQLATGLIVKYNDGCFTTSPTSIMNKIDYPKKWLNDAGYFEGPVEY
ncbi:MAG TPA: C69 family dipeptidase [Clostridia bacterium]|nr:C69 family dipeptidase [Clostridia bacterium]